MRILYIDCDSLRPDHLGCYGYERETSPNIDRIAEDGRVFTNFYASDAPCLPSRTAFYTGRFGYHTGVINHGGRNADPRRHGGVRESRYPRKYRTLATILKEEGLKTAMVSPFPARHDGWQVVEGFVETYDTGGGGGETADDVYPFARDWLADNAADDDWFLHVNFWDPHTSHRTPEEYGYPFADEPAPDWLTEEIIAEQYEESGAHSARDLRGWGTRVWEMSRMPTEIADRDDFKRFVDGYDVGVNYMDHYIGNLFDLLREEDVFEDTLVILSGDHGENLGELNVYGDHQTADDKTCRLPLVVSGPGVESGTDDEFRYNVDLTATIADLAGADVPAGWDGETFARAVTEGDAAVAGGDGPAAGREYLVLTQGTWAVQRGVRWGDYLLLRTYHDAFKSDLEEVLLFDLAEDPHETTDLSAERPAVVDAGLAKLQRWIDERARETVEDERGGNPASPDALIDPIWEVLGGKGPYYTWDKLEMYTDHLESTGRADKAELLRDRHGR